MPRALVWLWSLLLAATISAPGLAQASEVEQRFQRGLDAYSAAAPDYPAARAAWTSALEEAKDASAHERALLCRNLGNVAYRQDRPLEAAGWFTAAIQLEPRDGDAWANLELARTKAGLEPADRGDLAATFQRLVHALSSSEAEWLALGAALCVALLIVLRALFFGRALTRWLTLAVLFAAALSVPWCVQLVEGRRDPLFVISTAGVAVQSEPRAASTKVAMLPPGGRAERIEELAGWVRVVSSAGERGWVPTEAVLALRR